MIADVDAPLPIDSKVKPKIALFGGSFDPPHKAHQEIALFLLDHKLVDQVWYVPVKLHPFGKNSSAEQDRLAMIRAVVEQLAQLRPEYTDKLKVETWELEQDQESYTIQTLDALAKLHPQYHFHWVIGADNLEKFKMWNSYKRILLEYGLFVFPRKGYIIKPIYEGMRILGDGPLIPVSSTNLRQQLSLVATEPDAQVERELQPVILPQVLNYAKTHHLYDPVRGINN